MTTNYRDRSDVPISEGRHSQLMALPGYSVVRHYDNHFTGGEHRYARLTWIGKDNGADVWFTLETDDGFRQQVRQYTREEDGVKAFEGWLRSKGCAEVVFDDETGAQTIMPILDMSGHVPRSHEEWTAAEGPTEADMVDLTEAASYGSW